VKTILAALVALAFAAPVRAQAPEPCVCAPFENSQSYYAVIHSHNLLGGPGAWLKWGCYPNLPPGSPGSPRYCVLAAPWSAIDLRRLGDRADTIRNAPDPLAAFAASWRRNVTLPFSDPSFDAIRAAIAADEQRQLQELLLMSP
jgi:hypothetical protein